MSLWERLCLALDTQVGGLLVGCCVLVVLLFSLYLFLRRRERARDRFAHAYQLRIQEAESLLRGFTLGKAHSPELFGRATPSRDANGQPVVVYIPTPGLLKKEEIIRLKAIGTEVYQEGQALALVYRGLLDNDATWLPTLEECAKDRLLTPAQTEEVLLQLAHTLADLHGSGPRVSSRFFHGALLPRAVYVDRVTKQVHLGELGLAYACGPAKLLGLLDSVRTGKHHLQGSAAASWLDQQRFLAPEQLDPSRASAVGQCSDLYSFGRIAESLFAGEVPQLWSRFVAACVQEAPSLRPKDFQELDDWLNDPELSLTMGGPMQAIDSPEVEAALDRLKLRKRTAPMSQGEELLQAAITAYEHGDLPAAERFYREARDKDPEAARRFREHLTQSI